MEKHSKSGISAGIMLIGLGILFFTGWWWPGIMLVIGTAIGAEKLFQGQTRQGLGIFLLFLAIPVVQTVISYNLIPWSMALALLFLGLGGVLIVRTFLTKA